MKGCKPSSVNSEASQLHGIQVSVLVDVSTDSVRWTSTHQPAAMALRHT